MTTDESQIGMVVKEGGGIRRTIDLRSFKEKLRAKLPTDSLVLSDLLLEPDTMRADRAAVLIPHYLRRLEWELEKRESAPGLPALVHP